MKKEVIKIFAFIIQGIKNLCQLLEPMPLKLYQRIAKTGQK